MNYIWQGQSDILDLEIKNAPPHLSPPLMHITSVIVTLMKNKAAIVLEEQLTGSHHTT